MCACVCGGCVCVFSPCVYSHNQIHKFFKNIQLNTSEYYDFRQVSSLTMSNRDITILYTETCNLIKSLAPL